MEGSISIQCPRSYSISSSSSPGAMGTYLGIVVPHAVLEYFGYYNMHFIQATCLLGYLRKCLALPLDLRYLGGSYEGWVGGSASTCVLAKRFWFWYRRKQDRTRAVSVMQCKSREVIDVYRYLGTYPIGTSFRLSDIEPPDSGRRIQFDSIFRNLFPTTAMQRQEWRNLGSFAKWYNAEHTLMHVLQYPHRRRGAAEVRTCSSFSTCWPQSVSPASQVLSRCD